MQMVNKTIKIYVTLVKYYPINESNIAYKCLRPSLIIPTVYKNRETSVFTLTNVIYMTETIYNDHHLQETKIKY